MKLLYCNECGDVFSLRYEWKTCSCGLSLGKYTNELDGVYLGPCTTLGFANASFVGAIKKQPKKYQGPGTGERFEAFIIEKNCRYIAHMSLRIVQ